MFRSFLQRAFGVSSVSTVEPHLPRRSIVERLEGRRLLTSYVYLDDGGVPGQVTEGGTNYVFTIGTQGGESGIVVNYRLTGSADVDEDYTASEWGMDSADGSFPVGITGDTGEIHITALHDDMIEGNETITLEILPGDGYEIGYPPDWEMPGDYSEQEITLKQAATTVAAPTSADPEWNGSTSTLTFTRPSSGTEVATLNVSITAGGIIQKNSSISHSFTQTPSSTATTPWVNQQSNSNGSVSFSFNVTPQTTLGTFVVRFQSGTVFRDITIIVN